MPKHPENVEQYLKIGCGRCRFGGTPQCKVHSWTEVLEQLRAILQQSALVEEIKWSAPCYTHSGKNILMLRAKCNFSVKRVFLIKQIENNQLNYGQYQNREKQKKLDYDRKLL